MIKDDTADETTIEDRIAMLRQQHLQPQEQQQANEQDNTTEATTVEDCIAMLQHHFLNCTY